MIVKTSVIASNISIMPDVMGDTNLLFDPQNTDALVDRLQLILDNPLKPDSLIDLGRSRAQEFSWQKTANQTLEVYHSVM